jgi:anti-sigma factor ChrR (cupin superfamily)
MKQDCDSLAWEDCRQAGVSLRTIHSTRDVGGCLSLLYRLAPGSKLPLPAQGDGQEILVLDGSWEGARGRLDFGGYALQPAKQTEAGLSSAGCTLFVRRGPQLGALDGALQIAFEAQPWLPGAGRLRVKPLSTGTAFVHWPAGERFLPHQHWGGEEIYVISGQFEDEHGKYPAGSWLQSPHLSAHHPFVVEETLIFVKTGHLLPPESRS